jgi:2-C-methyl-D-erythritol 2,4-cyclodiphosphate synthase
MPEEILNNNPTFRIGLGNDIHKLVEGRKLILGGVEIPFEKGLLGHSDADCLTHAICDALLGAANLGDIGTHFSDKDSRWAGADSIKLLARVCEMLAENNWKIVNLDTIIQAENPKMMPHIPAMKSKLAAAINIPESCISIKAKTNEGLDAIGCGEAISAQAIAMISRQ